jgi:hypothetical protein
MEFVSKQQAYDATQKLALEYGLDGLARGMSMDGDRSVEPELYKEYLDEITADPLSPQDAMAATAAFMEKHTRSGDGSSRDLVRQAKILGEDPEKGNPALWNRWIELLSSV